MMLQRNLPNRMINTISVHFFDSLTSCKFYPSGTVFGSIIVIFAIFADSCNDFSALPVFVDVYTSPTYLIFVNQTYILFG
jgi:hypothetical protein